MNRQGKGKIEWTDYTWNPVVGCKNDCFYCYGKRIAKRFFKDNPNYEPKFYEERLEEPYGIKKPSKIFVCSMADLFGDWVDKKWIMEIIGVAYGNPRHTFQFLTKNPKRYYDFKFPENCWIGATVEGDNLKNSLYRINNLERMKLDFKNASKIFVSIEPLLGDKITCLNALDLVIVGAMTGAGAVKPKKEWIKSIKHKNIFYKENIKKYL